MGGRSGKQCRERWYNHLSPAVTKAEWSVEEDDAIHRKVLELGTRRGMHTQEWLHHSLLSRSASLLSRAQGIRARLPLTYSYPTPSREESAVAVQAQPPVLAVLLLAVLHRECGLPTNSVCHRVYMVAHSAPSSTYM